MSKKTFRDILLITLILFVTILMSRKIDSLESSITTNKPTIIDSSNVDIFKGYIQGYLDGLKAIEVDRVTIDSINVITLENE